jgi:hypothetical protein
MTHPDAQASSMSADLILQQTRHWLEKAVIGLNLCPFAKAVYVKNQVRLVVIQDLPDLCTVRDEGY